MRRCPSRRTPWRVSQPPRASTLQSGSGAVRAGSPGSATVSSLLIASSATLALNSGARCRRAGHGNRFAAPPADHDLRHSGLDPASAGIDGTERTRDACRCLQRHPERSRALLQLIRRRLHAPYAAPHLVGDRPSWWSCADTSGVARLHPAAVRVCRTSVRHRPAWACV